MFGGCLFSPGVSLRPCSLKKKRTVVPKKKKAEREDDQIRLTLVRAVSRSSRHGSLTRNASY